MKDRALLGGDVTINVWTSSNFEFVKQNSVSLRF